MKQVINEPYNFPSPPPPPQKSSRTKIIAVIAVIAVVVVSAFVLVSNGNNLFSSPNSTSSANPTSSATSTPSSIATPSSSPTTLATPEPLVGSVQGQLLGYNTSTPISEATVFLCPIIGTNECQIQSNNSVITTDDGNFTFKDVTPGSYVLVLGLAGEFNVTAQSCDGKIIRFTDIDSLLDTFTEEGVTLSTNEGQGGFEMRIEAGQIGVYSIIGGAVTAQDTGLRMEFRNSGQTIIEVKRGETARITFTVTEDLPDGEP